MKNLWYCPFCGVKACPLPQLQALHQNGLCPHKTITEPRAFVLRMRAPPMDDFAWGAKLIPPRVMSLGSDLSIIKMYQVTYIFDWCCFYYFLRNSLVALLEALFAQVYLLKEHIHVTTSIEQHIHALFCVYVCYNEYWTTYTCVYTLKEHIHVFILLKNIYMCL